MGLKTKRLLKEELSSEYADVIVVNDDTEFTPYIVTIGTYRFLVFESEGWMALSDAMDYAKYKGLFDGFFTYDEVMDWMKENATSYSYDELKDEMAEIEEKIDSMESNIGKTIDDNWSEYRELEKERDRIADEIESCEDELNSYISEYFEADENYETFIFNDECDVEEIDEDDAIEIVERAKENSEY